MADQTLSPAKEKLVYVVEDDDALREMTAYLFRKEGFQVDLFEDGKQALEAVEQLLPDRAPDLIVLDLMMPKGGGFDLVRSLQATPGGAGIPIFVITGRHIDRSTIQTLQQEPNVALFMAKPIDQKGILAAAHGRLGTRPS
jgi:DNA-binding response OmpR family regulator